jgi:Flp pilus assembly protein TadB
MWGGVGWVTGRPPSGATPSRSAGPLDSRAGRIASAAAGGALLALLIGGVAGIVIGIAAAVTVRWALGRREPAATRLAREQAQADLPLAVELLAAALRAGAPVDHALLAVAEALPGSLADRLTRTGRAMRLGATTADATRHLADLTGAGRLITAMERSSASGAALAEVLTRTASDLRQAHQLRLEASARRAAVLLVLPLGFCFLPAFVLAGLVPVLLAMLGDSTI